MNNKILPNKAEELITSPIYLALLIATIFVLILMYIEYNDENYKYIKLFVYGTIVSITGLFLHDYIISNQFEEKYESKNNAEIISAATSVAEPQSLNTL